MDETTAREIIQQIASLIDEKYVFPDVGSQVAEYLRQWVDEQTPPLPPPELADVLNEIFASLTNDSHLRIDYDPKRAVGGGDTEELMRRHFESARRNNFGFLKVERLAGNIGYLLFREFAPPEVAGDVAAGAMSFMSNTKTLIFDIRGNGGGTPEMVQLLISYLVSEEPQPLTGIYSRAPAYRIAAICMGNMVIAFTYSFFRFELIFHYSLQPPVRGDARLAGHAILIWLVNCDSLSSRLGNTKSRYRFATVTLDDTEGMSHPRVHSCFFIMSQPEYEFWIAIVIEPEDGNRSVSLIQDIHHYWNVNFLLA